MQLANLRDEIENELRWAPSAAAHKSDLTRTINGVYQALLSEQKWSFLEHHTDLPTSIDRTFTAATVTNGSHLVTGLTSLATTIVGHTFIGPDGAENIVTGRPGLTSLKLLTAYAGATVVGTASCSLKFFRYLLPQECSEVLGLMSRDNDQGEIPLVDRSSERHLMLNDDETGSPSAYLLDDSLERRTPRKAMAIVGDAAGSTLVVGTTYRYFYAYNYAGTYSSPSAIVELAPTAGLRSLALSAIETSTANDGRIKKLYRDDGDGIFRYIADVAETASTYTDSGTAADEDIVWDDLGPYRSVRLWPRPSAATTFELRYLRRPRRLQHDNDSPYLPPEFHRILVHLALVDICTRFQAHEMARLHQKRADEMKNLMRRRYLSSSGQRWVREAWSGSSRKGTRPLVTFT